MADTNASGAAPAAAPAQAETAPSPVISKGQTTSVGENTTTLEAQPIDAQPEAKPSSIWDNWLLFAVAGLWIWYLFGNKKRRQQKANEKKEAERRNTLQKGDHIVTIGRMHGTVVAFTEETVTLKPDGKADYTMTFDRNAIFRVMPRPGEEEAAAAGSEKK